MWEITGRGCEKGDETNLKGMHAWEKTGSTVERST